MDKVNDGGALAVFSGKCLKGYCGTPAGFSDMNGKPLHVGDIVLTFTVKEWAGGDDSWLEYFPDGLTVVVSDEWTSYTDGTHARNDGQPEYFVMGIKGVPMDEPGQWRVMLVKSHADVIDGERWPDYGFNYARGVQ